MQGLRDLGIEPYPAAEYVVTCFSTEVKDRFVDPELDEEGNALPPKTREEGKLYTGDEISIAGRLMSRRIMGKASFAEIQDSKFNRDVSLIF